MDRRHFITLSAGTIGLALMVQSVGAQELNAQQKASTIQIKLTSVYVDDQDKALKFYTEVLGFMKKHDVPVGPARWLTLVSPHEPDGTELLLEPLGLSAAKTYQKALFDAGVPFTAFLAADVQKEYERLSALGVKFRMKPMKMGLTTATHFEDTCGNLIQLFQP